MLFSALASAQLLLFSLPVGLFYFFAPFSPLFHLPSSPPKPDISQDFLPFSWDIHSEDLNCLLDTEDSPRVQYLWLYPFYKIDSDSNR